MHLSTQEYWVLSTGEVLGKPDEMLGGNLAIDWYPIRGRGVVALLVTSFYRNSIELQPDGASWPEC